MKHKNKFQNKIDLTTKNELSWLLVYGMFNDSNSNDDDPISKSKLTNEMGK